MWNSKEEMLKKIFESNILEPDEFKPPMRSPYTELELEKLELSDNICPRFEFPPNVMFDELFNKMRDIIIIDPLAYYVPYHSEPRAWGIYFRINKESRR